MYHDHETVEELYDGRARITRTYEEDYYFDVYGEPEGYEDAKGVWHTPEEESKEIYRQIEHEGLYVYFAQIRCKCCGSWKNVDAIGMVIGDLDPEYREDFIHSIDNALA